MSLAYRISRFNRHRKWQLFLDRFCPEAITRILDVGYTNCEYSDVENFLERAFPYPEKVVALGIERAREFSDRYSGVRVVQYDGEHFPFRDNSFDVVWSNAVIEHVGDRTRQLRFLREVVRVGRAGFITTPNRRFPIEVHTNTPLLHLLPKSVFDRYLRATGKGWAAGGYMDLLTFSEFRELLLQAGLENHRIQLNRIGPWTLDFVATWGTVDSRRTARRQHRRMGL